MPCAFLFVCLFGNIFSIIAMFAIFQGSPNPKNH